MANEQNLTQKGKHLSTEEAQRMGRKGGKNSVESRRERKLLKDILLEELHKDAGSGLTKLQYLAVKCIADTAKGKVTLKDLKVLQDLLGESQTNINVSGDGVNIIVESKERADKVRNIGNLNA